MLLCLLPACGSDSSSENPPPDGDQSENDGDVDGDVETPDGDDEIPGSVDDLVALGKEYLEAGESLAAYDVFKQAVSLEPEHPDALFGLCLAQFQNWIGLLDSGLGLLNGTAMGDDGPEPPEDARLKSFKEGESDRGMIRDILDSLRLQSEEQLTRLDALKAVEGFEFRLDGFPVLLQNKEYMNLHSEWDTADLYVLSAITRLLSSIVLLLDSQGLDFDNDSVSDIGDTEDPLAFIVEFLEANPDFLTFRGEEGLASWEASRQALADAAADAIQAASLMEVETDNQNDDIMARNDGLTVQGVEHFAVQGWFNSGLNRVMLLWHGEELSVRESLLRIQAHLSGQAEVRLRLEKDILMAIGVLLDFIRKAMGLEDALALVGVDELPTAIGTILENIGMEEGESFPKTLIGFLPMMGLPKEAIEIDLVTFYSRPYPFKEFIPNLGESPFDGATVFLQSTECARLGFADEDFVPGDTVEIKLHDRGPTADATGGAGNDQLSVKVFSVLLPETEDGEVEILDRESLSLSEHATVAGFFEGELPSAFTEAAAVVQDDGTVQIPDGATLLAGYTDANGEEEILVEAGLIFGRPEGEEAPASDVFSYDMDCKEGTGRDYGHFSQPEFAAAYTIADPPAEVEPTTPYPAIEADGVAADGAYLPFKSGSFNGLLWLDMGKVLKDDAVPNGFEEEFRRSDTRMTNAFMQKVMGSMGGGLF